MELTESRVRANRENAQHSTGPRTDEGKKRSSLNALRHGFTSQVVVLPNEDMQAYLTLHKQLSDFWAPQSIQEQRLVQRLIDFDWRLNRCPSLEKLYVRPRPLRDAANIDPDHPEIHAALTAARVLRDQSGQLESISRHEYRLSRMYQTTLKELKDAQRQRKIQEKIEFTEAEDLYLTAKMKGIPYNPAEDGFVLTVAQLDARGARLDRRFEAKIARQVNFNLVEYDRLMAAA